MEHTNEFLQGMFAAYMGCEVLNTDEGKNLKMIGLSGSFISVYEPPYPFCESESDEYEWMYSECRLILTPLSEISNDDAVEVAKIFKYQVSEHDKLKFLGLELVDSLVKYELDGFMLRDILAIIDYLRSKHYDCGYLQISSLIEAGLAVKATK
jgi:hypothetical protein